MKRFIDFSTATIMLVLLSPLFFIIAFLILITDGSPVFYRQARVGRFCKTFTMFKFRSMTVDADVVGGYATVEGDPRITRLGRVLRRTSMDELPQLFNVLLGHMSIVGPRPDVPAQRSGYDNREWSERHAVRPGITGLAQATLRSSATPDERKALDLAYSRNPRLVDDFRIIFLTIQQVFTRGGN